MPIVVTSVNNNNNNNEKINETNNDIIQITTNSMADRLSLLLGSVRGCLCLPSSLMIGFGRSIEMRIIDWLTITKGKFHSSWH